ncbi:hypothetical protein [Rhizobium terrae]|uniref:hypothetical protein n=1 Tax=Rhizobium terrae TaxID=2171756 RepID=UPI001D033364|nr:hypothetical protein [Rhizobium terrae]
MYGKFRLLLEIYDDPGACVVAGNPCAEGKQGLFRGTRGHRGSGRDTTAEQQQNGSDSRKKARRTRDKGFSRVRLNTRAQTKTRIKSPAECQKLAAKVPVLKPFALKKKRIIRPILAIHKPRNSIQNMANLAFPLLL